jgi:DNA-binding transcriptional MerR regulator
MTVFRVEGGTVEWAIRDVAKATGLTSRSLRHYEQIGLLAPSRVGPNGYRYYGDRELARLYRILSLRALDLPLAVIQKALSKDDEDIASAMRTHLIVLNERQEHTAAQIESIELALSAFENGTVMTINDRFAGIDHTDHEQEVRQRWGDQAWENSQDSRTAMTDQQRATEDHRTNDVNAALIAAAENGVEPGAAQFQALITEHYAWVTDQWAGRRPTREAYIGLAQMYVADERFASYYGGQRNAETIRTAIKQWASSHL